MVNQASYVCIALLSDISMVLKSLGTMRTLYVLILRTQIQNGIVFKMQSMKTVSHRIYIRSCCQPFC
jgi:hypothetical protein